MKRPDQVEPGRPAPATCALLAVDLDGTLLDSQHALPAANRDALHRAHAAGVRVVLCTGRAFTETRSVLAALGLELDAAITVFGALVTEVATGRTLHRAPLARATADGLAAWLGQRGYPVFWLTDADEVGHDGYLIAGPRRHPAVDRWLERSPCRVTEVDRVPADAAPPLRISIIDESPALDEVSAAMTATWAGRVTHNVLHAPPYSLSLIECFAPHVNKWYSIEQLCRRWSIDPRQTVAIGDDVNDLAMIQNAGLGVAMANARPVVRAAAARVTTSNDECGVARILNELLDRDGGRR